MRHGREWWSGHVSAWRSSGLSQAEYCRRHGVVQGSLARWATKLKNDGGRDLIEVGPSLGSGGSGSSRPIELVVQGRYLLRLWPGTDGGHLRNVISVLEDRR